MNKRFNLIGTVIRNSLDKTIVVNVVQKYRHPIYQKIISRTKKYLVHDPQNVCQVNDQVLIGSTRKISLRKSFFLIKVLNSDHKSNSKISQTANSTNLNNEEVKDDSEGNKT